MPPQEQRRRLLEIAASYHGHYLAAVEFVAEQNMTVGTINPARTTAGDPGPAHEICIDARGNASVSLACRRRPPRSSLALGRLLVWLAVLLVAAGATAYFL